MTVRDLIYELQKYNLETPVFVLEKTPKNLNLIDLNSSQINYESDLELLSEEISVKTAFDNGLILGVYPTLD